MDKTNKETDEPTSSLAFNFWESSSIPACCESPETINSIRSKLVEELHAKWQEKHTKDPALVLPVTIAATNFKLIWYMKWLSQFIRETSNDITV